MATPSDIFAGMGPLSYLWTVLYRAGADSFGLARVFLFLALICVALVSRFLHDPEGIEKRIKSGRTAVIVLAAWIVADIRWAS
jgi:hypothetical protein